MDGSFEMSHDSFSQYPLHLETAANVQTTGVLPVAFAEPLRPRLPSIDDGIRTVPLPGVRCPTCAANGQEVWVIPGRACGNCGTPCY